MEASRRLSRGKSIYDNRKMTFPEGLGMQELFLRGKTKLPRVIPEKEKLPNLGLACLY